MNKKVSSESVVKDIRFMATDVVRKESIRKAKDTDKAKYSIRVDRKKPKEIALLIISNIAYNRLASGHGYVYRGVLSTIGKEYLKVFNVALGANVSLEVIREFLGHSDIKSTLVYARNIVFQFQFIMLSNISILLFLPMFIIGNFFCFYKYMVKAKITYSVF